MVKALPYLHDEPQSFPSASTPYASPEQVVFRDGQLQVDNGNCHTPRDVLFFTGQAPTHKADCLPNEVEVPDLIGQSLHAARVRLAGQPLTPSVSYRPAKPGQRLNVVLAQSPRRGRLSAYDKVELVLAEPTHGVVPRLIGLPVTKAQRKLERRGLKVSVEKASRGRAGHVIFQLPRAGVAAAPGMLVRIAVAA